MNCACEKAIVIEEKNILEEFARIREKCCALKEILLPDSIWSDFQKIGFKNIDEANNRSILLLALERGYLRKITSPIHRYLIKEGKPRKELIPQYKKDLNENWMLKIEDTYIRRHQKAKEFLGKLTELLTAEWIEKQGWMISSLEALGGNCDIEALSPENVEVAIEVKYIGQEDDKLIAAVKSRLGRPEAHNFSSKMASNFILFKAYEASKQLQNINKPRIAIIVISENSWVFMKKPVNANWMYWESPRFFNSEQKWNSFLEKQKKKFPNIEKEIGNALGFLSELWIVKASSGFQYSLHQIINF
jgi:hypothetical protein